jgi:outer membrane cobalamin receptor
MAAAVAWLSGHSSASAGDDAAAIEAGVAASDAGAEQTDAGAEMIPPRSNETPPPAAEPPRPSYQTVVVAPRAPRSSSETTRTRALLEAAPHRSADELLTVMPGVFITQHGGEGKAYQIFYRGFDAVHGQDLEIWAGGAPVNDVSNVHGQGYADLHFIPTEVVRQIVATPGTYDARQGDFAVAGSMRFDLGYDVPGATASVKVGSFGSRRAFLAYHPPGGDAGTFGAVELYETNGFGPSRAAQRASVMGQTVLALGDGTKLRLLASAYAGHFASAGVLRLDEVEAGRIDRFATYDATQGGASSRAQLVTEIAHRGERTGWRLATYVVLRSLRLRQNFTGFLTDPNGDSSQQLNDDLVVGTTGAYDFRFPLLSPADTIEVGFFGRTDWIDQSQKRVATFDNRVTADQVDARVRAHDIAGYVDLSLHPFSRLAVRGGLRADGLAYYAQENGAAAAGQARASQGTHIGKKLNLDGRLTSALRALASYGEGFRSPQARSLAEGETTPFTSVRSFELGLRLATTVVSGSLAAFETRLSDDLVFDQSTGRNERVPATRRTGAAAELSATPRPWLVGAASATYTRAAFTGSDADYHAGDLVPYAPQWVLRSDAAATPELGTWHGWPTRARLGGGTSWLARRPLPYGEWGHDVFLVDATAAVRLGRVEVGLEVFNLLDARWYDGEFVYASRFHPAEAPALVPQRHVTVGAPRTFYLSVSAFL